MAYSTRAVNRLSDAMLPARSDIINQMRFQGQLPLLKIASVLLALYSFLWISLEGELWQVLLLALALLIVGAGIIWRRYLVDHTFSTLSWLLATGFTGLIIGLLIGLLAILLMTVKTGLHGHGPEFTHAEIIWVLNQIPLWSAVGLLLGVGTGIVIAGYRKD